MIKNALGAAVLAAVIFAAGPAGAAKMKIGCSGPEQEKAESAIDSMADGPGRMMGQEEIALAQTDMLSGHMAGCASHLSRAMNDAANPYQPMHPVMPPRSSTEKVKPAI